MTYQPPPSPYQQPGQPPPYGAVPPYGMPPFPAPPKKSSAGKTVLIVVGALFALVLVVCVGAAIVGGGGSGKPTVDKPAAAGTGTAAEATTAAGTDEPTDAGQAKNTFNVPPGSTITVTAGNGDKGEATVRSAKTYSKGCGEFAPDPENKVFVVVDVLVQWRAGTGSVNPLDFTFVSDDGTSATGISGAFSGCDKPSLDATNSLRAGQKRAGKIAFDATSGKGAVEWAPGGLGSDTVGSWKIG